MAAEMINSVAFELAKMIGGCCKMSERTYVASCERTWEMQPLKWEVASLLVAAAGPSPLALSLLLSGVCFSSRSIRERRNGAFQLPRNY